MRKHWGRTWVRSDAHYWRVNYGCQVSYHWQWKVLFFSFLNGDETTLSSLLPHSGSSLEVFKSNYQSLRISWGDVGQLSPAHLGDSLAALHWVQQHRLPAKTVNKTAAGFPLIISQWGWERGPWTKCPSKWTVSIVANLLIQVWLAL